MPLKTDTIDEPDLNLTPMIDIVFLLIIFFMIGTQFTEMERQFDIQLPTVSEAQPLTTLPDEIIINVSNDGGLVMNNRPRTMDELERDLIAARRNYADQAILIRGDGQGPYQHVMNVLAVCRRAKINFVSLANRLKPEDEP